MAPTDEKLFDAQRNNPAYPAAERMIGIERRQFSRRLSERVVNGGDPRREDPPDRQTGAAAASPAEDRRPGDSPDLQDESPQDRRRA